MEARRPARLPLDHHLWLRDARLSLRRHRADRGLARDVRAVRNRAGDEFPGRAHDAAPLDCRGRDCGWRNSATNGRMKTFYSPAHLEHAPSQEFEGGRM